jgi:putative flippase GtrA
VNPTSRRKGVAAALWREFLLAGRFALVGATATLVHMLMVAALIELVSLPPLLANLIAFLTAFGVSFAGHYFWTFRAPGNPVRAMRRLFIISGTAFAANTVLLAGLLKAGWLSPTGSALLAAALVPAITFLASRLWGFRPAGGRPGVSE